MPKWIPEGWHSVTPRLVVDDPAKLVLFIKSTFAAGGNDWQIATLLGA